MWRCPSSVFDQFGEPMSQGPKRWSPLVSAPFGCLEFGQLTILGDFGKQNLVVVRCKGLVDIAIQHLG